MDTDARNVRIGGVLSQMQDCQYREVAYFSKTLSMTEFKVHVTQRDLQALMQKLDQFHKYIDGQVFNLPNDHSALTRLVSFKNLKGQTGHFAQHLQEYNFTSEPRPGGKHTNANKF
jgi:hypothetical protein